MGLLRARGLAPAQIKDALKVPLTVCSLYNPHYGLTLLASSVLCRTIAVSVSERVVSLLTG